MTIPRRPRQPLVGLFIFAAAGILAAEYGPAGKAVIIVAFAALAISAAVAMRWRRTAATFVLTACAFFLLHRFAMQDVPGRDLAAAFADKPLVKATGIVATAPQEKTTSRGRLESEFQLHLEAVEIDGHTSPADAVVLAKWVGDTPAYGDRVSITGEMDDIPAPRNPGQFDYAAYMHRLGIYSEISMLDAASGEVLDGGHGNPLVALALNTRHWVQQKLQVDLEDSPNVSGLVQSLTLGLKNETPEETRELFQRTGTLHLFVVNGLHIGMFTTIMFLLVRLFGAGRVLSVLIVAPLVCFYALLTGSSTGSVRATVMTLIILGGMLADGKPAMMNNLAAAGLAILAWNTNELLMPGFQFSFGVVFTIILLAGPLQNYFAKFGKPDEFLPRALWNRRQRALNYCSWNVAAMLGVSISATLGSLPFAASYFDLLTPSALAANLVVVPMAFLILTQSILSAVGGIFSTSLSAVFNNVNWVIANMVLATVRFFSQFPGGHFYVEMPPFQSKPACEITVLDLGDGGAVHVRSQARDWLLDCGNTGPYESTVRNYLHSRGVNRLDCFVVTHGNSKFIGGAKSVEEDFTPVVSADSPLDDRSPVRRAYHDWLSANALTRANWKRGDALDVSVVAKIRVLYPPPDSAARLADDKTLVMRLECGGCRVLFMSGAGAFTEQWLHDNEPDLRCDILVRSPHSGESAALLDAAQPQVIICSCSNLAAGRIDEAWAGVVASRGIPLFRQDETGAVNVKLDSGKFIVKAFLGGRTFEGKGRGGK